MSHFFYKTSSSESQLSPELVAYEYWIDDNYSSATFVNEAPQQQFNISNLLSMSSLNNGIHTFNIRFKDNTGLWSSVATNFFYKTEEQIVSQNVITEYRYWFDNDFATAVNVSLLPNQQINLMDDLDLTQKPKGFHEIHFQFKDTLGWWSVVLVDTVEKISLPIAGFSYSAIQNCDSTVINFIDNSIDGDVYTWDFGDGNTSSVADPEHIYYMPGTYTVSQTVSDTITLADSTTFQTIVITGNTFSTIAPAVCDNYTSPSGNIFNVSGVYMDTIENACGCDSIVTINLIVNNSTNFTDIHTACGSFTWIDGNTYFSNNDTATYILENEVGCDSIITLNLTINPIPDNSVTQNEITLTANQVGASYQWLDCDNSNAPITNENGQSFTATENGNYAVEVSLNGCSEISNCYAITTVEIVENMFNHNIILYPNPTKEKIMIDLGESYDEITLTVQSLSGQIIKQKQYKNQQILKLSLDVPDGIYLISLVSNNKKAIMRVVKH